MLIVELGQKIDPFEEASKWISASGINLRMKNDQIRVSGPLEKEHLSRISYLDIAKISNEKEMVERKTANDLILGNNGRNRTYYGANYVGEAKDTSRRILKGQVWYVDFGQPVGNEFGYIHPAIVLGKSSTSDCIKVLPCTTKAREGRVYKIQLNDKTLNSADSNFLELSENKMSYVLFDHQEAVDRARFQKYLGTLTEEMLNDILKAMGYSDAEIKREIRFEYLNLTEKQQKIIELTNRNSDLLAVANNTDFTYEHRVKGVLGVFGFKDEVGEDIEFLMKLIHNTRFKTHIDMRKEAEVLARNTLLTHQTIQCRLVELTKKKFKDLHPCLLEFVTLVNKMTA